MSRRLSVITIINWLLLAALIGAGWYYWEQVIYVGRTAIGQVAPCATPIRYRLGEFDTRFDYSQQQFLSVIEESAAAWSEPVGKPLFAYHPEGELVINLIYDYRQAATDQLGEMGITMDENRNQYDQLKAEYDNRQAEIAWLEAAYERNRDQYAARGRAYEAEVNRWNAAGGAPPPEFDRLNREKAALAQQQAGLEAEAARLNQKIDELNAVVTVLNGVGARLNRQVEDYNQTAMARGEKFQEGEYIRDAAGTRINIYEFRDETMLRRVMMHELGHALGLDHVADPQAIMYELNSAPEAVLAASDRQIVQQQCEFEWPAWAVVE
jgi:hypothetical protein